MYCGVGIISSSQRCLYSVTSMLWALFFLL
jgi:hypothetical protein